MQVIAAEGEQKASRALKEAAEVIAESSAALQVGVWTVTQCNGDYSMKKNAKSFVNSGLFYQ